MTVSTSIVNGNSNQDCKSLLRPAVGICTIFDAQLNAR